MRSSYQYRERDYAFGNLCLTLRTHIGVTQGEFADLLGISERAIQSWEVGESYPKVERLKRLIAVCVQHHVFEPSHQEEEIRALWQAAHQRVLLDEPWLRALLTPASGAHEVAGAAREITAEAVTAMGVTGTPVLAPTPASLPRTRIDWVGALDVSGFQGREVELAELSQWILQEHCRLITILGMGGIGKSALVSLLGQQLAPQFEAVLWRSVRDAPSSEELVADVITFCSETPPAELPVSLERRIDHLVVRLQNRRCLLVLDNLETLLEERDSEGNYRPGYEGYGRLIQRLAETAHQSCVLVTSREKPKELEALEGSRSPVRSLRLMGLSDEEAHSLLADKDLRGDPAAWHQFIASYAGNPLALKIVAQTIADMFSGDIAQFLHEGELIFNGIRAVLRQQVSRLTQLEQTLLTWLAVVREWTSLEHLLEVLVPRAPRRQAMEALEALRRRSLLEQGQQATYSLQSVVMEYITDTLVEQLGEEIVTGQGDRLRRYALEQAQTKNYVRESQVRLLVRPLLERLRVELGHDARVEKQLLGQLDRFRSADAVAQGYGPASVISLLKELRGDLRGLDLSRLSIRGAYLQGVEMQDASLSGAHLNRVRFTEAFDAGLAVAISPDGRSWAAGSKSGEVRIWHDEGQTAYVAVRVHTNRVSTLAFSPDGRTLASGSWDCTVKLWDVASKALLWNFQGHEGYVQSVAFGPDGGLLASGSDDGSIKLWDLSDGRCLRTLRGHQENVYAVAWHPDGHLLASGSFDRMIRIWDVESGKCLRTLSGHTHWVMGLAFTPDGKTLASGGADNLVKLWEVDSGRCQHTLAGHTDLVRTVAWSPDGQALVSGSYDTTIRLWQPSREMTRQTLLGHTDLVHSVVFTPDGKMLLSGSEDRTLRVWEIISGQCLRILQGYSVILYAVTWSPESHFLASEGTDCTITIWDIASRRPVKSLQGHTQPVYTLAWHPNGRLLASGGYDQTVRIWDTTTGKLVQLFRAHTSWITRVAWSPDGAWLASASYDQVLRVWDVSNSTCRWVGHAHTSLVSAVCWSPDGTRLATCSDDHTVRLWQAEDGILLRTLQGHSKDVAGIVWSPDGRLLASCGGGGSNGELLLWDARSGQLLRSLVGHPSHVFAIAWDPQGDILVSAGIDGTLRWWNVESGVCLHVRQGHQAWIRSIAISPNGEMLASCGHDGVTHIWEMQSAAYLCTLRGDRPYERLAIVETTGLNEAQKTTLRALGAIEAATPVTDGIG